MQIQRHKITLAAIAIILLAGLLLTWLTWDLTTHRLSEDALEQARIAAASINPDRIQRLRGNKKDLDSPDYIRIKDQLKQIRQSHRSCRFLYLMGRNNSGTVFFFVDSQPEGSKDYASPGLVYDEVSDDYLYTFDTGKARTVGPIKDRWGTLITSLVPINSRQTHELIAVLGMDITDKDWNKIVLSLCLLPVSLTLLLMITTIFLYKLNQSRQTIKRQFEEKNRIAAELQESLKHVKQLQGILPICAKCKKIRNDQGYWTQIEFYISEHSEADFSHGICPECAKKIYGKIALDDFKK